jgi:hypothetical protein
MVSVGGTLGAALLAGLLAGVLAATVVSRWAAYAVTHDRPDERFVLQGHVATIVRSESAGRSAEIEYRANGRRVVVPAHAIGNVSLVEGTDVVIDRLEAGVAFVEAWSQVEERI